MAFNTKKGPPIFNPKNTILKQSVAGQITDDKLLEVIVAEIFSPEKFFIQLKGDSTSRSLEIMMNKMEEFYDIHGDNYKVTDSSLVPGFICASQFIDGNWYRARALYIDKDGIQVFYLDYGTTTVVQRNTLCYLLQQFSQLPCQAIAAKLFGVRPTEDSLEWSVASSNRFLELVSGPSRGGGVLAYVKSVGSELSLWMVDTVTNNLENGIEINQALVNEGYAMADDDSENNTVVDDERQTPYFNFTSSESSFGREDLGSNHSNDTIAKAVELKLESPLKTSTPQRVRHIEGVSNSVQNLVDEMRSRLSVDAKPENIQQMSHQFNEDTHSRDGTVKDDIAQYCRNNASTADDKKCSITTSRALFKNRGESTTADNPIESGTMAMTKVLQKYDTDAAMDDTAQYLSRKTTTDITESNQVCITTSRATMKRDVQSADDEANQHHRKEDTEDDINPSGKIPTTRAMYKESISSRRAPLRRPFQTSSPAMSKSFASSSSFTSSSSESSFGAED